MEFPPNIALEIVDKTLGGNVEAHTKERNLTEIEAAIIYNLMKNLMSSLKEAWVQAYTISPVVDCMNMATYPARGIPKR
jgi:flagellar motor switch protein FliM